MASIATQLKQLAAQGSTNIDALGLVVGGEIMADPDVAGNAILKVEYNIRVRLKSSDSPVPWGNFSQQERIFMREQWERLALKRLPDSSVCSRGAFGLRQKEDMIKFLRSSAGGTCCFELFREYPNAHRDVLELLATGDAVSYGTTIWDGHADFKACITP